MIGFVNMSAGHDYHHGILVVCTLSILLLPISIDKYGEDFFPPPFFSINMSILQYCIEMQTVH